MLERYWCLTESTDLHWWLRDSILFWTMEKMDWCVSLVYCKSSFWVCIITILATWVWVRLLRNYIRSTGSFECKLLLNSTFRNIICINLQRSQLSSWFASAYWHVRCILEGYCYGFSVWPTTFRFVYNITHSYC